MIRVGILTVSDRCAWGERDDVSGPEIAAHLPSDDYDVYLRVVVPDEEGEIAMNLVAMCEAGCDLVITTGGTGFAPRDVTPEATVSILDRNAPGIAELLRADGLRKVPTAALGRGVAGIHDQTLIVNLPGSPGAVRDGMRILMPILPHAVALLRGESAGHA
jgi:molybdopterin adenylyltransferase